MISSAMSHGIFILEIIKRCTRFFLWSVYGISVWEGQPERALVYVLWNWWYGNVQTVE